jgi:hypothetical protein
MVLLSRRLPGIVCKNNRTRVSRFGPAGQQIHALPSLRDAERSRVHDAVSPPVAETLQLLDDVQERRAAG